MTVHLGRIAFPALSAPLQEALGSKLTTTGAAVIAGEPEARPFPLSVPIIGSTFAAAETLRRQVRALLDNPAATAAGLAFRFDVDPVQDGWLAIGAAQLAYGAGGPSVADYTLELSDCYRVATPRSHRPGRRVTLRALTDGVTPRDALRRLYSTQFAAWTGQPRAVLPPGSSDWSTRRGPLHQPAVLPSEGGDQYVVDPLELADGLGITYEQPIEQSHTAADVTVTDAETGEELYGPNQEITPGTVPQIGNGQCLVRWTGTHFAIDQWTVTDGYIERARIGAYEAIAPGRTLLSTVLSARVDSWTPERAVLAVVLRNETSRTEVFVTLRRGDPGPRLEAYHRNFTSAQAVVWRASAVTAGLVNVTKGNAAPADLTPWASTSGGFAADRGSFAASNNRPWASISAASNQVLVLGLQNSAGMWTLVDSDAYGAPRGAVELGGYEPLLGCGYASVQTGFVTSDLSFSERAAADLLARSWLVEATLTPELTAR